jgi:SAM-dependent methyltransferase
VVRAGCWLQFGERGVDIEGVDVSPDMLAQCRRKLAHENLTAPLYEQDMVDFDTGRKYNTIFISGGSFQLLDELDNALGALKKIHEHLQPGGQLVLDIFCPWDPIRMNHEGQWLIRRTAKNEKQEELWCYDCSSFDVEEVVQTTRNRYASSLPIQFQALLSR